MHDFRKLPLFFFLVVVQFIATTGVAQGNELPVSYKNMISTNLMLPIFGSVDINYERTVANKWAFGMAGAVYGSGARDLATVSSSYYDYQTNWELMPFGRVYFQGAQNKSHFVELFGSLSESEETGRLVRTTNGEGFGVYIIGSRVYTVGGLGAGYGYRFLFLDKRVVLEAQFGVRTNFNIDFILLNGALVRTGIRVGYRF